MMNYDMPPNTTPCGNAVCKHLAGIHYETFDGTKTGCSFIKEGWSDQREGTSYPATPCPCDGFAIIFRPRRPPQSQATLTDAYYQK